VSKGYVQLELELDWGATPWHGVAPRYLTRCFLDRRFGGTGRANRDAREKEPERREDLQLWLFNDEVIS